MISLYLATMRILFRYKSTSTKIFGTLKTLGLSRTTEFHLNRHGQFLNRYETSLFNQIDANIKIECYHDYQGLAGFIPEVGD